MTELSAAEAATARRSAARLAESLDPSLPAMTERALAGAEATRSAVTFDPGTSIALAGLLLSIVQFGWTVYRDLRKDRLERESDEPQTSSPTPAMPVREVLVRRLRLRIGEPRGMRYEHRDRLVEVVAEEILAQGSDEH